MDRLTFSYRKKDNIDTLCGGPLQQYRLMYWLADVLKNFFSDPVNVHDERISALLGLKDITPEQLDALIQVGVPYSDNSQKACLTPAIIVSVGAVSYPAESLNSRSFSTGAVGDATTGGGSVIKAIQCTITVATESYAGTVLLAGILEHFFLFNREIMTRDNGSIHRIAVTGVSEPQEIAQGQALNAKPLYQAGISLNVFGGVAWRTDTQGPVYRGVSRG